MKYFKIIILITIIIQLSSCNKNEGKNQIEDNKTPITKQQTKIPIEIKTDTLVINDSITNNNDTLTTNTVLAKTNKTKAKTKKNKSKTFKTNNLITNSSEEVSKPELPSKKTKEIEYKAFLNFRKMMSDSKIGETLTQNELINTYKMPEEGVKLMKSITKVSADEVLIKWKSTWMVEKVSDAKFEDGKLKFRFEKDKMYTSGNAIGIKYNKKIYTDLILKNGVAYIPNVKGYYWQIGR